MRRRTQSSGRPRSPPSNRRAASSRARSRTCRVAPAWSGTKEKTPGLDSNTTARRWQSRQRSSNVVGCCRTPPARQSKATSRRSPRRTDAKDAPHPGQASTAFGPSCMSTTIGRPFMRGSFALSPRVVKRGAALESSGESSEAAIRAVFSGSWVPEEGVARSCTESTQWTEYRNDRRPTKWRRGAKRP